MPTHAACPHGTTSPFLPWTAPDPYGAIYGMFEPTQTAGAWRQLLPGGMTGHHALFELGMVRFTMGREDSPPLGPEAQTRLLSVLAAVEQAQDADEGRDWIAGAPLEVQETLVRAYFATLFQLLDRQGSLAN